jgi:hypothetical protein
MCVRFAVLAGVTTAVIAVMVKEVTADQHLLLTRGADGRSVPATRAEANQPCRCSDASESSATKRASTPSADGVDAETQREAAAQREKADRERMLLEGELNDIKKQLAAVQQFQAQKDAQIAHIKEQLDRTPTIASSGTKTPVWPSARGRTGSRPVVAGRARARHARWAGRFFGRPWMVDCTHGFRSLYYYGPYEVSPF